MTADPNTWALPEKCTRLYQSPLGPALCGGPLQPRRLAGSLAATLECAWCGTVPQTLPQKRIA